MKNDRPTGPVVARPPTVLVASAAGNRRLRRRVRELGRAAGRAVTAAGLLVAPLVLAAAPHVSANAEGTGLVISQVYGGGGNSGAPLRHDFVELFNPTPNAIDLTGLSVQYASATGTGNFGSNPIVPLAGTLGAGQYFLVQEASGGTSGALLPTPDATGGANMSATAGKVALVSSTTGLACNGGSTPCSAAQLAQIVDLVGYGGANFFEGAGAAPTLGNTTAALRNGGGCADTDNNNADFTAGTPTPRNTATAAHSCFFISVSNVSAVEGDTGTSTFTFTVALSRPPTAPVTLGVATTDVTATAPDDYTSLASTAVLDATQLSATFDVTVNGDIVVEPDDTFTLSATVQPGSAPEYAGQTAEGTGTILNDDVDCTLPFTPINQIQGSGASTPLAGMTITTQGIVVGDFEGSAGLQGFYLQDTHPDGDPATSEGIFVLTGSADTVIAGETVRVTGVARERFGQTTVAGADSNSVPVAATSIGHCRGFSDSVTPTDVQLPFAAADSPEPYEAMLVRFPQALVISEYFNYDRFGEIVLARPLDGESRLFTPTLVESPGAAAQARALANSLSRITLDDGLSVSNPEYLRHPDGLAFSLTNRFRGGDTVTDTVGVLGFDFGVYRIQPTAPATYTELNPRPAAPEDVSGTVRAAAMNTLNFFLTLDDGAPHCGPDLTLLCRGANDDGELTRQRTKLIHALAGLQADVLGLNELENTTGVDPLLDADRGIVAGLNDLQGAGTYAAINTGVIGTDAIRVGLVYKPGVLTAVGRFKLLDSSVDPRFMDTKNRPSLAQTFEVNATGARFTVVVNHLKSKGSDCDDLGDPDTGDGQGNCNLTRTNAARALVDWLATDPTGSGDPDYLVLGDMNSYAMEDPITAVRAGADDTLGTGDDFTNLISKYQGAFAYSYVFDAQAGYLDHALASATFTAQVDDAADWHINADEPDVFDYDTSFKGPAQEALYEPNQYRTSDHDPVLIGLNPNAAPTVDPGGPYQVDEGGAVTLSASGIDPNGDALTYAWDLDGDGTFETPGPNVTFDATALDGPTTRTVSVQVTDGGGLTGIAGTTVTVLNVAPVAAISGPSAASAGSSTTWTFSASDVPADVAAGFTFSIDWGDGSTSSAGGASAGVAHTYDLPGEYTITATATDDDGGVSAFAGKMIGVSGAVLHADPCVSDAQALLVAGTLGDDQVAVRPVKGSTQIEVVINGTVAGRFSPTGQIIILGLSGDDTITIGAKIDRQRLIYGGEGNDALSTGNGSGVLLGGAGVDQLSGGNGRDVFLGGAGGDTLGGGKGDDILIAGATGLDEPTATNQQALCSILQQWNRLDLPYAARVAALLGAFGTLSDDGAADSLAGGSGLDWFVLHSAQDTSDRAGTEVVTEA